MSVRTSAFPLRLRGTDREGGQEGLPSGRLGVTTLRRGWSWGSWWCGSSRCHLSSQPHQCHDTAYSRCQKRQPEPGRDRIKLDEIETGDDVVGDVGGEAEQGQDGEAGDLTGSLLSHECDDGDHDTRDKGNMPSPSVPLIVMKDTLAHGRRLPRATNPPTTAIAMASFLVAGLFIQRFNWGPSICVDSAIGSAERSRPQRLRRISEAVIDSDGSASGRVAGRQGPRRIAARKRRGGLRRLTLAP